MASTHALLGVALGLAGLTVIVGGCQQENATLGTLPSPNFGGPAVAASGAAPLPAAAAPAARPAPAKVAAAPAAGPREWVPDAAARPWKWIVVHHSATPSGNLAMFDREHREKGWDECGYHFVIDNGTLARGDGQVEVGPRWPVQKWGAHAKTADNRFNLYGIGICLVGNFDLDRPTPAQMASLDRLVTYLMRTYHIAPDRVVGHRETKPTDCPGKNVNLAQVRRMVAQALADEGDAAPAAPREAVAASDAPGGAELLTDRPPR